MPALLLLLLLCCLGPSAHAQAGRTLVVVNASGQPVTEIHVTAATEDSWGDDVLGDQPLAPRARITVHLPVTRACLTDVQVVYADNRTEERRALNVCRVRSVTFTGAQARLPDAELPNRQLTILNRSARPIAQVFISEASSDDWGGDRLADQAIAPAARADVGYKGGCRADVRVVFDNKSAEERRELDLCTTEMLVIKPGWTTSDDHGQLDTIVAPAALPQVAVVNKSDATITQLYLTPERLTTVPASATTPSPANDDTLGIDKLGRTVLRPGARTFVAFDRGSTCRVSVHAIFQNDHPDTRQTTDLCQSAEIVIAP